MTHRLLIKNVSVAQMAEDGAGYDLLSDAALLVDGDRITWVGPMAEVDPAQPGVEEIDGAGRLLTPALIDCHTHIVHGGNRAREFEMRLQGASYEEVARAGGGIVSTVTATRETSETALLEQALTRADALIAEGVATIEVKSGYGLDRDTELKMLRVARAIEQARPLRVVTSFLGAHAVPKSMDPDAYIDEVCIPALRAAHAEGLVDAVDGFCEGIAFTPAQIARVFDAAQALGLPVKLHSDQLSNLGGTPLAARYGALSVDHVEYSGAADAQAMAEAGSVATLLPGAFYTLHETQKPPVAAFRAHGVPMAVATDWNPGSSPMGSVLLAMNMACTLFGLTPAEALAGATRNAAADLALWDVETPAELSYRIGINSLKLRIFGGQTCH
jgi:imidazolonepropionase